MPVTYHVDPTTGVLHVKRSGEVSAEEDEMSFEARLADAAVMEGIPVLVDCAEIEPADSVERVHCMAERVTWNAHRLKCGPVAILVSSDVEFGMARMYMALTDHVHPHTMVFRDRHEALEWLETMRAAGPTA
jgi:hypothetical protein